MLNYRKKASCGRIIIEREGVSMSTITYGVTKLLQAHRSIRKFQQKPISQQDMEQIILSAQAAPTSSHVQAYSIVGVTDQTKRDRIAEYAGNQAYISTCSHFLVFCADFYRLEKLLSARQIDATPALETTEKLLVGTVDASLAAQNAAIAAESLGLGIVYIGGIRRNPDKVSELLRLPHRVYPVFGVCLGYPDQDPQTKPRLPMDVIYHENEYIEFEQQRGFLQEYDEQVKQYYTQRTGGTRQDTWSDSMEKLLTQPSREHMQSFLEERGFART